MLGKFNVSLDRPASSAAKSYAIAASFVDGKFPKKDNFPPMVMVALKRLPVLYVLYLIERERERERVLK